MAEDYVHRIGRTGRLRHLLVAAIEGIIRAIERLTKQSISPSRLAGFEASAEDFPRHRSWYRRRCKEPRDPG